MKDFLKQHLATGVTFGIPLVALAGFWKLMNLYQEVYFLHEGEAFMKGYGHILKEDFDKGLIFILLVNSLPPILLTFLFFLLFNREVQIITYKLLRVVALSILFVLLGYLASKLKEEISFTIDGNERLIELSLTWSLRITSFFLGYQLVKSSLKQRRT